MRVVPAVQFRSKALGQTAPVMQFHEPQIQLRIDAWGRDRASARRAAPMTVADSPKAR